MSEFPRVTGTELSEGEVRSVLDSNRHGVLSMGVENRGYGLPMAYSYDEENERLLLGFVDLPESKKIHFASRTEEVTLTVYQYEDVDSWRSVVVTGSLEPLSDPDVSPDVLPVFFLADGENSNGDDSDGGNSNDDGLDGATEVESRFVELDEYDRQWYELRIDDVSGRHSGWP